MHLSCVSCIATVMNYVGSHLFQQLPSKFIIFHHSYNKISLVETVPQAFHFCRRSSFWILLGKKITVKCIKIDLGLAKFSRLQFLFISLRMYMIELDYISSEIYISFRCAFCGCIISLYGSVWYIYLYSLRLLHWQGGNLMIAPVPVK